MKNSIFLFLSILVLFVSCRQGLDEGLRKAYLEEHIENCSYLIGKALGDFERYRIIYRGDTYFQSFIKPLESCHKFSDLLYENPKENITRNDIPPDFWKEAQILQDSTYDKVQQITPRFLRQRMPMPAMEALYGYDSDELKMAKYFTNCLRLIQTLYTTLKTCETPSQRLLNGELKFMTVLVPSDTVKVGEPFHAITAPAYFEDFSQYSELKNLHDIIPHGIDPKTGRFRFVVTGPAPRCDIIYFDTRELKEVRYEVVL